jgi:hypothetical protein
MTSTARKNTGNAWRVRIIGKRFAVVDTRYDRGVELVVRWRIPGRFPETYARVKRFDDYRQALRTVRRLNRIGAGGAR